MRILLVEDDRDLGGAVRDYIAQIGHAVDLVTRLSEAWNCIRVTEYDLILLDLMLPDGLGVTFLRDIRKQGWSTPVLILTAMDRIQDRIEGLDAGADDYLVKPFDLDELSARLRAVARRHMGAASSVRTFGPIKVDFAARHLTRDDKPVVLTAREWTLLETLANRPDQVLTRTQLEDRLYPFGEEVESNAVEAIVSRLRRKVGRDAVLTVRGIGYKSGLAE